MGAGAASGAIFVFSRRTKEECITQAYQTDRKHKFNSELISNAINHNWLEQ